MVNYRQEIAKREFSLERNNWEMKQLLMQGIMLRAWQAEYKTWGDVISNFDTLIQKGYKEKLIDPKQDEQDQIERVVFRMRHIFEYYTADHFVFRMGNKFLPRFICQTGNDGDLIYYYKCEDCGTIAVVDHSHSDCMKQIFCPNCCPPLTDKPLLHKYIKPNDKDYESLMAFIKADQFYQNNVWYQKWSYFKFKISLLFMKIFQRKKLAESVKKMGV
jgi:hypothetical protein